MAKDIKRSRLGVFLLMIAGCSSAAAGDFKRFELQPFGGFTASGRIPLTSSDDSRNGSTHVDSSYSVGITFAVNLNALDAIEGSWQRQFTKGRLSPEIAAPAIPADFDLDIDQIHCNFLHHYEIAGTRAMPYVMAALGITTYHGGRGVLHDSESHFSFSLGGGVKYFFTNHFGIRGEARWSPTLLSASDSRFWCRVGGAETSTCVVKLKISLKNQLDLTGGLVFRF